MSDTTIRLGLTALLLTVSPVAAWASCSAALPLVNTAVPTLPGRIVFQGASSSGDTQLYTFDFASKVQTAISASWGLTALRNPAFSPDGKRVAFTGVSGNTRDDYIFTFGATMPVNLTNGSNTGAVSEDPKWSSDGTKLIIKQNGNIQIATLAFNTSGIPSITSITPLTTDGVRGQPSERSQPYLSPDGKYAFYVRGTGSGQRVKYTTVTSPSEQQFAQNSFYSYYPIVRDYTVIYYTGWTSSTGPYDQIFLQLPSINGLTVTQPSFMPAMLTTRMLLRSTATISSFRPTVRPCSRAAPIEQCWRRSTAAKFGI